MQQSIQGRSPARSVCSQIRQIRFQELASPPGDPVALGRPPKLPALGVLFFARGAGGRSLASGDVVGPGWGDTGGALGSRHGLEDVPRHAGCCHYGGHPHGCRLKALCFHPFTHLPSISTCESRESKVHGLPVAVCPKPHSMPGPGGSRYVLMQQMPDRQTRRRNKRWRLRHSLSKRRLLGECKMLPYLLEPR